MIVLGANLTTDRTLYLDRLIPGHVIRPSRALATAGGKAVNVCRAATAHGVRPRLVANLPGRMGGVVGDLLDAEGHDVRRVATSGEIRSAIVILETDLRTTVLNEPGPQLTPADRAALLDAFAAECVGHTVAVVSGSLPPGPESTGLYAEVVARAHRQGLQIVLDAAREDLLTALPAGPDVVTPNLAEALAVITGHPAAESVEADGPELRPTAIDAAQQLRARGAKAALVTVGRHGVAGAGVTGTFWIDAPSVRQVNPIGAGDSFAAGLGVGLERGLALPEATALATATGAASVVTDLAGRVDVALMNRLLTSLLDRRPR